MPYSPRTKALAHRIDPKCWISYSGKDVSTKRAMDARRCAALEMAHKVLPQTDEAAPYSFANILLANLKKIMNSVPPWAKGLPFKAERKTMHSLKLQMMLHFATRAQAFAPETVRTSNAYVTFVRELLRDELIERPTKEQRAAYPGWAYKATPRGRCFVKALTETPLPVRTNPEWTMPVK
jgi:hypothetical protein